MFHIPMPKTEYISFDVFDTLIKRNVMEPKDLFRLMERVYGKEGKLPKDFANQRIAAEKKAKEKNKNPITIEQIYAELQKKFGNVVLEWMDLEIQTELDICRPNISCTNFFYQCLKAGKTVILISDMYLSSVTIVQMLEKCGITGYHKLYISCEWRANKRNGSLFRLVLRDLGIQSREITHIGDGKCNDFLSPLLLGIHAIHIQNNEKRLNKWPSCICDESIFSYRTLQACIVNCTQAMSEVEMAGATILGPLLLGYSYWLAEELCKDDIYDVYFLARDGWMLKRAFDQLNIEGIHTHYLYGSRRSYLVPTLWRHPEFEEVASRMKAHKQMTLEVFLKRIGLNAEQYRDMAKKFKIALDKVYEHGSFWKAIEVREFYDCIMEDVVRNSKVEYEAILSYFHECGFSGKIAIADIGYRGTIQNLLCELVQEGEIDAEIIGYYISLDPDSDLVKGNAIQAKEYLSNFFMGKNYLYYIRSASMLFEAQFLKNEGSVDYFYLQDGQPKIHLQKFEYDVETEKLLDEVEVITDYQSGALRFIQDVCSGGQALNFPIEPDVAFCHWYCLIHHPSLHETNIWGDFRGENGELYFMARPRKKYQYLFHPQSFKRDFIYECKWKIGFLKRMFKLPLPYDKIYFFLRDKYNKE